MQCDVIVCVTQNEGVRGRELQGTKPDHDRISVPERKSDVIEGYQGRGDCDVAPCYS